MSTKRAYNSTTSPISGGQIKKLHALANAMGWDKEQYRDNLQAQTRQETSLKLTFNQAGSLIEDWERKAVAGGVWKQIGSKPVQGSRLQTTNQEPVQPRTGLKFTDMDGRPGFASGSQCRLIDALWSQVTRAEDEEAKEKALNSFCHRISGVAGLRMVKMFQVEKIIKALEAMGAVIKKSGQK
ncbi:MAG: phage protein GemA/Gp16 family protein [Leptolinea sp.]